MCSGHRARWRSTNSWPYKKKRTMRNFTPRKRCDDESSSNDKTKDSSSTVCLPNTIAICSVSVLSRSGSRKATKIVDSFVKSICDGFFVCFSEVSKCHSGNSGRTFWEESGTSLHHVCHCLSHRNLRVSRTNGTSWRCRTCKYGFAASALLPIRI